ncbi:retinol dehydrogenase 11-like [Vanessa atalanta]|uniref:retinol dehydrogenase 11-like n=1 Tax=Vanessa atalanta TaxID=42275 RepID=UPI001FCD92E5|nr:retinol dehydrogenase 11-like [Vanessa atalanta]
MSLLLLIVVVIIIVALTVGLYEKSTNAICTSKKRLDGKTAIVTGGTTGMGLQIATDFADRGARVIIACPFKNEGVDALKYISDKTSNTDVVFKMLDLSSITSIREFATDVLNNEKRLDILMNNAGVGAVREFITDDGMSFIMQVNYFGQFLLTLLLLPLLNKTGTTSDPARIVNTSSVLHNFGFINIHKINDLRYWFPVQFYANSKLSVMLFAHELTKRLKRNNVVVNCVDPGMVGTGIFRSVGNILGGVLTMIGFVLFKTPWLGAQTAIHVALDKKAGEISGQLFKNCKLTRAKRSAYNDEIAGELWNISTSLVGLSSEAMEKCFQ